MQNSEWGPQVIKALGYCFILGLTIFLALLMVSFVIACDYEVASDVRDCFHGTPLTTQGTNGAETAVGAEETSGVVKEVARYHFFT